jgi:hypothetical protein
MQFDVLVVVGHHGGRVTGLARLECTIMMDAVDELLRGLIITLLGEGRLSGNSKQQPCPSIS